MNERYLPIRLTQHVVIQEVGDETLVYDERRHTAFCLNQIASAVWNQCDGQQDATQIAERVTGLLARPVTTEIVEFSLAQLSNDGLLQRPFANATAEVAAISRRSLMARAGAGAVMLLPVVAAVMAPRAAQAYNGGVDLPTDDPSHGDSIPADPGEPSHSSSGPFSSGGSSPLFPEEPK